MTELTLHIKRGLPPVRKQSCSTFISYNDLSPFTRVSICVSVFHDIKNQMSSQIIQESEFEHIDQFGQVTSISLN